MAVCLPRGQGQANLQRMPKGDPMLKETYRTVLVTGASSGIGRAVAGELLAAGLEVYGTSRKPDPGGPGEIRWLRLEGATPEGVQAFLEENKALLGQVDILVNNAGWSSFGSLGETAAEALDQQLQLLLRTPVQLMRAVLPGMRRRGCGCIVNVSSLAAHFPLPFMSAYTAGKAGLSAFTRSLILSEPGEGVCLVDFQAGDFRTAFNDRMSRVETLGSRERAAWAQLEKHLRSAPGAAIAARDMMRAIRAGRSAVVKSGGLFQTRIAPIGARILPVGCLLRAIRWYYKLPSG